MAAKTQAQLIKEVEHQVVETIKSTLEASYTQPLKALERRVEGTEKKACDNEKLLKGNGKPEDGLLFSNSELKKDMQEINRRLGRIEKVMYSAGGLIIAWVLNQWLGLIPIH